MMPSMKSDLAAHQRKFHKIINFNIFDLLRAVVRPCGSGRVRALRERVYAPLEEAVKAFVPEDTLLGEFKIHLKERGNAVRGDRSRMSTDLRMAAALLSDQNSLMLAHP